MGLSGKYDFGGIKKWGAKGLTLALASTTWGASVVGSVFQPVINVLLEFFVNWLTNKGLILINIGATIVEGEIDQKKFDQAIEEGLAKVKIPGLTDKEKKAIDEKVVLAIRKFGRVTDHNDGVPDVSSV